MATIDLSHRGRNAASGAVTAHGSEAVTVRLAGEHDIATVVDDDRVLLGAVAASDSHVVVDLREVTFMSAATVGVIVRARRALESDGRGLTLRAPSPVAQRVLDVCAIAAGEPTPG